MGRRVLPYGLLLAAFTLAAAGWMVLPASGRAATTCPPVTISDLTTTTTTTSSTTTTSTPTTTTSTSTSTSTSTTTPNTTAPTTTSTPAGSTTTTTATSTTATSTTQPQSSTTTTTTTTPTTTTTTPTTTTPTTTTTRPEPECDAPFVYPMVFPVLGNGGIGSPFGAPRDGGRRLHEGNDLFAAHLTPVVAVADGTVTRIARDAGISGNYVGISHHDGWSSLYIHLNNDTVGSDDSRGVGVRPDLAEGDEVVAGEVIGWIGDSGNAEETIHHLHFELHDSSGTAVDPEPSLRSAERHSPSLPDGVPAFDGPFPDQQWTHEDGRPRPGLSPLAILLSRGIPVWCDEFAALACPGDPLTAAAASSWLAPILAPTDAGIDSPGLGDDTPTKPVADSDEGTVNPTGSLCLDPGGCAEPESAPANTGAVDRMRMMVCRELGGCKDQKPERSKQGITQADVARIFAWDIMTDRYNSRAFTIREGVPDASWTTPAAKPPKSPAGVSLADAYRVLDLKRRCIPLPDTTAALNRASAARWIVRYLTSAAPTQCVAGEDAPTR